LSCFETIYIVKCYIIKGDLTSKKAVEIQASYLCGTNEWTRERKKRKRSLYEHQWHHRQLARWENPSWNPFCSTL